MEKPIFNNIDEILDYGKKMEGRTVKELLIEKGISIDINNSNKGRVGQKIENIFGIRNNSKKLPDFEDLGVELKTMSITKQKNGKYKVNRLTLTTIDLMTPLPKDYKESCIYDKSKEIILTLCEKNSKNILDSKILSVDKMDISKEDMDIILDDYIRIEEAKKNGIAHKVGEKYTNNIGLCAGNDKKKRVCYKCGFMRKYINNLLENKGLLN